MRFAGLLLALATVATASWLSDEYWTLIGPNGEPIQGESSNFARVAHFFKPDENNRFVAYWMTNTHYAGRMFEQFGEAFLKEGEEKYCARFTGEHGEAIETCENFRILTVPQSYKGRTIFEWVKIEGSPEDQDDKIGYNDHQICAFAYEPEQTPAGVKYDGFTFGDAVPSKNAANAVNTRIGIPLDSYDLYYLRLIVGVNQERIPHQPAPASHHHAHRQHQERQPNVQHHQHNQHQQAQDQQAQQDAEYQRRLADYNERLRQQQLQQQQRDQYEQQKVQQQQQTNHHQQQQQHQQQHTSIADSRFICDTYGRIFENQKKDDGSAHYVTYDVAAHGGVKPPCVLIGETPSQSVRQEEERVEQQQQQRAYPVRRSCSGSRQKKDAEDDC